ncbi:MAG: DUF4124 domain-containing protein [Gammaproteobacteria bacterium]|nr:DUF4124 domain-containing protein [Gammaproteobacteria bacterium]
MLKCLIALTSLLSAAAVAAPAWTWVDEQGRRHYSDTPVPGATRIEIAEPQTFGAPPRATPSTSSTANSSTANSSAANSAEAGSGEPFRYSVVDVISPADGDTLWNIGAELTLELAIYPALQSSHRIDVVLDGNYVALGSRSLSVTVPDVFRGEHTVQAVIVDQDGNELARSAEIGITVQQTSLQNPNNPNFRPPGPPPPNN